MVDCVITDSSNFTNTLTAIDSWSLSKGSCTLTVITAIKRYDKGLKTTERIDFTLEVNIRNLHANFPLSKIRPLQDYVLKEIADALQSGYKIIVLEAPTGFGKSAVAVALARTLDESYFCTGTKDLQDQYHQDFPYIWKILGRNNFSCYELENMGGELRPGEKPMCDMGPCQTSGYKCSYKPNIKQYVRIGSIVQYDETYTFEGDDGEKVKVTVEKPCLYYDQKHKGLTINHTIMNYRYFFTLCKFTSNDIATRSLIVFDEAHSMEEQMIDFAKFVFTRNGMQQLVPEFKFPVCSKTEKFDIQYWRQYLIALKASLDKAITFLTESNHHERTKLLKGIQKDPYVKGILDSSKVKLTEEYTDDFRKMVDKLSELIKSLQAQPENWVIRTVLEKSSNGIDMIEFVPLDISQYFQPIYEKGNIILCMSATILDKNAFCKSVGLPLDKVKYIPVQSDFPVENRLIYPMSVQKLNSRTLQDEKVQETIAKSIDKILDKHSRDKGIIHTTSYKQSNFIKNHLSSTNRARIIETGYQLDRVKLLSDHRQRTDASVLMSPSLHTGLDLKDELSRFQVMVKVPYPDMGDRWIKAKMEKSQEWYNWQTALKLVQAYGRSIRSKTDYAKTYILDSQFAYFVSMNRNILPKWFTDAIRYQLPADVANCKGST